MANNEKRQERDVAVMDAPIVSPAAATTTGTTNYSLAGYGTNKKTQAQVDALTKATIDDFQNGFAWRYAVVIGQSNTGTADVPVWAPLYELRTVTVDDSTINQDLMDFQNALRQQAAYI